MLFTTQHGNFLSVIMHVYRSLKNLDFALDHPYFANFAVSTISLCLKDPSLSIRHGESNRIFSRTNGYISHACAVRS